MTKTRLFTISTLCVILFGVVGYGVYNYIRQYRENSYTDIEISPTSPYSFTQKEIVDGETFSLPFLPPETSLTLDIDIFQPKREIESSQGIDIEDLTIVELTFKNIKFLSLRIGIYSPTRDKVIQAGSLGIGPNPNHFIPKRETLTIFLINENRVNLEAFSKLNPSAYVVSLPKTDIFSLPSDYTKYLIIPMGSSSQNTIEVNSSIFKITDKQ